MTRSGILSQGNLERIFIGESKDYVSFSPRTIIIDNSGVNKFVITGRGGIPSSPNEMLQNDSVETNWVTTDPPINNSEEEDSSANPDRSTSSTIQVSKTPTLIEAQGWIYGSDGEILLTAHPSPVSPHNPSLRLSPCGNAN